jgi:hypothetical protein
LFNEDHALTNVLLSPQVSVKELAICDMVLNA